MNISLRKRLIGGFILVIVGLLILSVVALFAIRGINKALNHVYATDFQPYKQVTGVSRSFYQWLRTLDDILADNNDDINEDERQLLIHWNRMRTRLDEQLQGNITASGRELLTSTLTDLQSFSITQDRIISLIHEDRLSEARLLWRREIRPRIESIEKGVESYMSLQERQFERSLEDTDTTARTAVVQIAILALILLLTAVLVTIMIVRAVSKALIAVQSAVRNLSASTKQIVATTSELTANAVETGTAVNQATATVEETRQTAHVSSDKARAVSDDAQRVSQVAANGRTMVMQTIESMRGIQQEMSSVAQSVMRLSEQSRAVGEIIDSVNDLAEQTNILSVNAAIEAARAAEHGKGFSVVAQEIRSLAERSKEATLRVREILSDIQKATSAAVMTAEQAGKRVDTGVHQSTKANDSIATLSDSISEAAQASVQIAASSSQQLVGMDQMKDAMGNINEASRQNVESAKQLEAAVMILDEQGAKLKTVSEAL